MSVIRKESQRTDNIGIQKITYCKGDFREEPYYSFTLFRNNNTYVETMKTESAEILMDLLNIPKESILT